MRVVIFLAIFIAFFPIVVVLSKEKNFYDILELRKDASGEKIRKQYRNLAKQYHPDKNDSPSAKEKFIEITKAYETLGDDSKKREYDESLRFGGIDGGQRTAFPFQQQGHHHPQQFHGGGGGGNERVYMHRTANGHVFFTTSSSSSQGHPSQGFDFSSSSFEQQGNLPWWIALLIQLWMSPIPFFLFLYSLYWLYSCCCGAPRAVPPAALPQPRDRERDETEEQERTLRRQSGLVTSLPNLSSIGNEYCVKALKMNKYLLISCSPVSSSVLASLREKFRRDPVLIVECASAFSAQAVEKSQRQQRQQQQRETDTDTVTRRRIQHSRGEERGGGEQSVSVVALRGGGRWSLFEYPGNPENTSNSNNHSSSNSCNVGPSQDSAATSATMAVENWVVKLLGGEMKWKHISDEDVPFNIAFPK